jgi:hypothetical protein
MDRFSKTCLALIATFLAVIALRPPLTAQTVTAAPSYEYQALSTTQPNLGKDIREVTAHGWEVFSVVPGSGAPGYVVVLRRSDSLAAPSGKK